MPEAFLLTGKIALVTGGGSGIGAATCRELSRAGAELLVADVNVGAAEEVAASLPAARAVAMDVTDPASIAKVAESQTRLNILINNAGIGHVGGIADVQPDDFDRLMKVNVYSIYYVTQAFLPLLLAAHGSIVNIGSVAGLVGIKGRFAYCATKGAVHAMTRQLAVEYPRELRVNSIAPGTVQTPFVEGYLEKYHAHEKDKVREQLIARQPVGRLGTPEDVAAMVRYLCSDEASFINGAIMPLDGGWTAA
ncbi:MAG: SDR family NAD(P)-dependent oxidoreductase [Janthinobacterium lividum]